MNKDRFEWPIAKIIAIIPGADGNVRASKVEMSGKTYLRPIDSLIPLEGMDISDRLPPGEDVAPSQRGQPE